MVRSVRCINKAGVLFHVVPCFQRLHKEVDAKKTNHYKEVARLSLLRERTSSKTRVAIRLNNFNIERTKIKGVERKTHEHVRLQTLIIGDYRIR